MAETDYVYDESAYLTASNISTQHGSAPNPVRGNLTTASRWLNTSTSPVVSHTNWYDTGEVYQAVDPLGHTTTPVSYQFVWLTTGLVLVFSHLLAVVRLPRTGLGAEPCCVLMFDAVR